MKISLVFGLIVLVPTVSMAGSTMLPEGCEWNGYRVICGSEAEDELEISRRAYRWITTPQGRFWERDPKIVNEIQSRTLLQRSHDRKLNELKIQQKVLILKKQELQKQQSAIVLKQIIYDLEIH